MVKNGKIKSQFLKNLNLCKDKMFYQFKIAVAPF